MKPIKLVMQAFGPYKGCEEIEFEHLSQDGIFLIKGPTGSGKTTIFDAMTIALFGGSSGEDSKNKTGRNDFSSWRCNQSDEDTPTIIEFYFAIEDCEFCFTRKMEKKRTAWSVTADASQLGEDGIFHPFFENPKIGDINQKAEQIIGLNKDQFRQVVLLPQGQFEKFLTASSSDKEVILSKIFGTDIWKQYADAFVEKTSKKYDDLKLIRSQVLAALTEEEKDFELVDDILVFVNALAEQLKVLDENHLKFDGEKRQLILNQDIALGEQFKELHKFEEKVALLFEKKGQMDAYKAQLVEAEEAESVRPYIEEVVEATKECDRREKELANANAKLPQCENSKKNAEEKLEKHRASSKVESNQTLIGELQGKEEAYANLDQVEADYKKAKESYKDAEAAVTVAETKMNASMANTLNKKNAVNEEERKAQSYRDTYYEGICGEIATDQLEPGKKCPVCGSLEHPAPAERIKDSVSKADLDKQENIVLAAKDALKKAEDAQKNAQETLKKCQEDFNLVKNNMIAFESTLKTLKDGLVADIHTLAELKKYIQNLIQENLSFEEEEKTLTNQLKQAENELTAQKTNIKNATEEAKTAKTKKELSEAELVKQLKAHKYKSLEEVKALLKSDSERDSMKKTITEYETSVKENQKSLTEKTAELQGKKEPDVSQIKERQQEINLEKTNYTKEHTSKENEIARLNKLHKKLKPMEEVFYKEIEQAESDYQFARKLRGDTGIGLQRYVLGIMFDQVICEANIMLQKVHGGRYHLFRSNEGGTGNKKGLELKVHDNRSPEKEGRSVSMLSGGEKFLVSLSLSIGMSTVAQQKGVHIDALFIDEGFGTLDETSIKDAMDILGCVQKSNGLIGIISHVKLLETTIMSSIEVIKTKDGSRIRVN